MGILILDVMLYNEHTSNFDTCNLTFKVINNLPYDMIIGKPDIKKYDLSTALRSQFASTTTKRPALTDCGDTRPSKRRGDKHIPQTNIANEPIHTSMETACDIGSQPSTKGDPDNNRPGSQNSDLPPRICCVTEPKEEAARLATTYIAYRDMIERVERINMVTQLQDLIGVEDEQDELSKEMEVDLKYTIPTDIYNDESNDLNKLIDNIHTDHFKTRHKTLYHKYSDLFSTTVWPDLADVPPMTLDVDVEKWRLPKNQQGVHKQSVEKQGEIRRQVDLMRNLHVIAGSEAEHYSQVVIAPKPNNKWRFCVDYKHLNQCTRSSGFPIPDIKQMINRLGEKRPKYMAVIDLTSGYHQAPLAVDSRVFTAFTCFMGLFEWLRVPFGLRARQGTSSRSWRQSSS